MTFTVTISYLKWLPAHLPGFLVLRSWIIVKYQTLFLKLDFKLRFEIVGLKELPTKFSLWSTMFFSNTICYVYSPKAKLWSSSPANRIGQVDIKQLLKVGHLFPWSSGHQFSGFLRDHFKNQGRDLWLYDWQKSNTPLYPTALHVCSTNQAD